MAKAHSEPISEEVQWHHPLLSPVEKKIKDRALQSDGPASTALLPVGTKVIAVTNPSATENAKRQALKRNRAIFGDEHVIETIDECDDGVVVKGKKIRTSKGTTLTRDVCVEKR